MKKITIAIYFIFYSIFFTCSVNSIENKILFKVNNEIITSLDIFNELKYLELINEQFKMIEDKQAYEIAKRSLIREKIKEIELKKVIKEIKLEEQFFNDVLINYFKKKKISSVSDFENYFTLMGISPKSIEKKITIEILWNQLIFSKYNQSVKINRQDIINKIRKDNKQKQFLLSEILFNLNEDENLDNKFSLIKNKIDNSNFSDAALIYSVSDTANNGGKLGWINERTVSEKINIVLQKIKVGNYSSPIIIPGGFLILKIEDTREVDSNFNEDEEIKEIIQKKTSEQLNQFSNIYFNKIRKNIIINEL